MSIPEGHVGLDEDNQLSHPGVLVRCEADPTVNYAMQQNDVPVIKRLVLENSGPTPVTDLRVDIAAEPAFAPALALQLAKLDPGEARDLQAGLALAPSFLSALSERLAGRLHFAVSTGETCLATHSMALDVLAHDEWSGIRSLPEILAAFVLPNHPAVQPVLSEAAGILAQWTGEGGLTGYQSKNPERVCQTAAAIYGALQKRQINYITPPASFEQNGQKIRMPDNILGNRLGTCLDLAVLFAACLEQAGLHSLLVLVEGHAFVGVWLEEKTFSDCATDDVLRLRKRVELCEICVFESTALTASSPASFDHAKALAEDRLRNVEAFRCVIDIARCRKNSIRPLPEAAASSAAADTLEPDGLDTPPALPQSFSALTRQLEPTPTVETPATRLDRWKRRLLDMSLNNRLLNFRQTRKTIRLLCPNLPSLEDALADGASFKVLPRPTDFASGRPRELSLLRERTGKDGLDELLRAEFSSKRLHADLAPAELAGNMLGLFRTMRTSLEESGANTLFLALGMLAWHESEQSTQRHLAPLILLPLEIMRSSVLEGFRIKLKDEEPRINTTLLEMLHKQFDLNITGLDPLPLDEHGLDVPHILDTFRKKVLRIDRWEVLKEAWIGLFSFTKFLMWRDLEMRTDDLLKNRVVDWLINRPGTAFPSGEFPDPEQLDEVRPPDATFCPLDADSSQLAAIYAAADGRSFVLHGPPGTGKSQTISNLVAHCLATGKTVLFVAEKMAALNVVHARLKKCGLDSFCLELHSNKCDKKRVLDDLAATLEARAGRTPGQWEREAKRLAEVRTRLNAFVHALHRPRAAGMNVFQGLSRLSGLRSAKRLPMSWPAADYFRQENLAAMRDCVERLALMARDCPRPRESPWNSVGLERRDMGAERAMTEAMADLEQEMATMRSMVVSLGPALGFASDPGLLDLTTLRSVLNFLAGAPDAPRELLVAPDWTGLKGEVEGLLVQGRARDNLRQDILGRYDHAVLGLDAVDLTERLSRADKAWFVPRWLGRRGVRKALAPLCREGLNSGTLDLAADLNKLVELESLREKLTRAAPRAECLLGSLWSQEEADWLGVEGLVQWCGQYHDLARKTAGASTELSQTLRERWAAALTHDQGGLDLAAHVNEYGLAFDRFSNALDRLEKLLLFDRVTILGKSGEPGTFGRLAKHLAQWRAGLDAFAGWVRWRTVRREALGHGLHVLVEAFEHGIVTPDEFGEVFERSFHQWWVESLVNAEPALREFYSPEYERLIAKFKQADSEFIALARMEIRARLAEKLPLPLAGRAGDDSEIGILKVQSQRRRGHMPVRSLFQKIPNLLPRLKPCLLMSPMSVAQYLDPAHPAFDLVIFDEASQMPVWDAVGAIARGREAVVVGDPKQLPPTSFFTRSDDEDMSDDDLSEDLESILDECIAARLPDLQLRWHYRSRHEGLIAFSNRHYYDNKLLTFPSPSRALGIVFRFVASGVYDKGKSRTNRAEAEAVAAEILRRLKDPKANTYSLGVVTFSISQQALVEDLLEEARRQHPEIEAFFGPDAQEPVFVKNLENVQGDERDVILFSVCYGPDFSGRISMNFGPLNKEGGERRLNVAITRARNEVLVFSSIRAEQVDPARTRARGVLDLKSFLDYAEHGFSVLGAENDTRNADEFDSPFEAQVCETLRERGHTVHTQVGCSGYRIDLAVVDPDSPGCYILGIECDGANYHRAKTARDRDRLRESVLRNLGWKLTRIWSTDWWNDPARIVERLEREITAAKEARVRTPEPLPPPRIVTAPATPPPPSPACEKLSVYSPYITSLVGTQETFHYPVSNQIIRQHVEAIVQCEGPMSLAVLAKRVATLWGFSMVTNKTLKRISSLLKQSEVQIVRHGKLVYIWPLGLSPMEYDTFRVQGEEKEARREAGDIPPEEVAAGMLHVLRQHISTSEESLIRDTARLFGFLRTGEKVNQHLRSCVPVLLKTGHAARDGDRILIKECKELQ